MERRLRTARFTVGSRRHRNRIADCRRGRRTTRAGLWDAFRRRPTQSRGADGVNHVRSDFSCRAI